MMIKIITVTKSSIRNGGGQKPKETYKQYFKLLFFH